ncbi:MAG: TonB-dependent receptor [Bacteroidales bacterium]
MKFKYILSLLFLLLVINFISSAENIKKSGPLDTPVEEYIIKGKIIDEHSQALPGVTIRIKNTNTGVISDMEGNFILTVHSMTNKLVFTSIGYKNIEQTVSKNMNIIMRDDSELLSEVIVTTQKKSESSIDVPTSLTAISGLNLKNMQIAEVSEMSDYISGLQIQIQSPNNPSYAIRGVTSDDGESFSQPRVSVFQDGVSISRSRASVVQLFDIERVEVAKGPQGTLFGRGAEIGGIHIIRNKPVDFFTGNFMIGYGTYNKKKAEGYINTPILNGTLANRFAFSYDAHDGFINNKSGGRLNGQNTIALRNSLRLFKSNKTTYDLVADYQYDNYPGTSFRTIKSEYGSNNFYDAANLEQGNNLYIHRHVGGLTFLINSDLNDKWKFSSITGARAFKSDESFDADGTNAYLLWCQEKEKGSQISQEIRFNYNNDKLSGFFGASYFYENSYQEVIVRSDIQQLFPAYIYKAYQKVAKPGLEQVQAMFPALSNMLPSEVVKKLESDYSSLMTKWFPSKYNLTDSEGNPSKELSTPNYYGDINNMLKANTGMDLDGMIDYIKSSMGSSGDAMVQQLTGLKNSLSSQSSLPFSDYHEESSTNNGTNQAAEIFADYSYEFIKNLKLTLGLRGTYENQKTGYKSDTQADPIFGIIMYNPTSEGKVSISKDYLSWVGRAAINYMYKRNNIYASISRGRRPGIIAFNNSPTNISKLDPEIIINYEIGMKGMLFNTKLNYELATYYYDWSHFQTYRLDMEHSTYISDDAGKAHTFGIETSLRYALNSYLNFFGNYSYIDGKFNDTDNNGEEQQYAGNRFRLTPKHSFAIGVNLNIPVNTTSQIYFTPSYTYKSKVYFNDSNEEYLTQNAYGIANFIAGYRFHPKGIYYDVNISGKNVFDQKYLIDAGNTGRLIGYPTYIGGNRSIFCLNFKIGF